VAAPLSTAQSKTEDRGPQWVDPAPRGTVTSTAAPTARALARYTSDGARRRDGNRGESSVWLLDEWSGRVVVPCSCVAWLCGVLECGGAGVVDEVAAVVG